MTDPKHDQEPPESSKFTTVRTRVGIVAALTSLYVGTVVVEPLYHILEGIGSFPSPLELVNLIGAPAGWLGLVYACLIRSAGISPAGLKLALAMGAVGGTITFLWFHAGGHFRDYLMAREYLTAFVFFSGIWLMNGLALVWLVERVRRVRVAANVDRDDS